MKNVFLATAAILSLLSCTEKQKQPNIIFILADDMGYGAMCLISTTILS